MENLESKPWYRPELTREQAEQLLAAGTNGDFFIRGSSQPSCVALSYRDGSGKIDHALILKSANGYKLTDEETTYPTLQVLLEACDKTLNIPREAGRIPGRQGIGLPPPGGFPRTQPPMGGAPRANPPSMSPTMSMGAPRANPPMSSMAPARAAPPSMAPSMAPSVGPASTTRPPAMGGRTPMPGMAMMPPPAQPMMSQPMMSPPPQRSTPAMGGRTPMPGMGMGMGAPPPQMQMNPPPSQPPMGGRAPLPGMGAQPMGGRAPLPGMGGAPARPQSSAQLTQPPPGRSMPPGRAPMGAQPRGPPPPMQSQNSNVSVKEQFDDLDNLLNDLNNEFNT